MSTFQRCLWVCYVQNICLSGVVIWYRENYLSAGKPFQPFCPLTLKTYVFFEVWKASAVPLDWGQQRLVLTAPLCTGLLGAINSRKRTALSSPPRSFSYRKEARPWRGSHLGKVQTDRVNYNHAEPVQGGGGERAIPPQGISWDLGLAFIIFASVEGRWPSSAGGRGRLRPGMVEINPQKGN